MLFSVFMLALRSVRRNLLRSFLTILGIVIGVGAVITMVTLGHGATQAIETQITSLGTNLLVVSPGQRIGGGGGGGGIPQFTEADATAVAAEIGGIDVVAPQGRTNVTVVANGRNWATSVVGSSNDWFKTGNWVLASGRLFEPDEQAAGAAVCIVGETVRRELYGGTPGQTGLGQQLRVKQFSCEVVGILLAKGQGGMGDQDDTVVLPLRTLQRRVTGSRKVGMLLVSMQDGSDSAPLKASLRQLLRERRKLADSDDDNFNIFDTQQLADTLSSTMGVLTQLLGAVAAVSLLVGGIGIMNIMLVSVTERTREIGLRMAVGARSRDILGQFLIEAVTLSLIGGAIGVVLGAIATWAVGTFAGWQVALSPAAIVLAVGFSAAVGVFFGYYPARKAAQPDPIRPLAAGAIAHLNADHADSLALIARTSRNRTSWKPPGWPCRHAPGRCWSQAQIEPAGSAGACKPRTCNCACAPVRACCVAAYNALGNSHSRRISTAVNRWPGKAQNRPIAPALDPDHFANVARLPKLAGIALTRTVPRESKCTQTLAGHRRDACGTRRGRPAADDPARLQGPRYPGRRCAGQPRALGVGMPRVSRRLQPPNRALQHVGRQPDGPRRARSRWSRRSCRTRSASCRARHGSKASTA